MRTYQRIAISRGRPDVAYPHNFVVIDMQTNMIKIGETNIKNAHLLPVVLLADDLDSSSDAPSSLSTIRSLGGDSSSPT